MALVAATGDHASVSPTPVLSDEELQIKRSGSGSGLGSTGLRIAEVIEMIRLVAITDQHCD